MRELGIWLIEHKSELLACFLEILMVLICLHGMFGKRFKFTVWNLLIVSFDLVAMVLINRDVVESWFSLIVYVSIFYFCLKVFRKKILETVGRFLIGLLITGLIEIITILISVPISDAFFGDETPMLLANFIGLILIYILFEILYMKKNKIRSHFDFEKWWTLIIVCGLGLIFLVIDYNVRGEVEPIYYITFITLCIIVCATLLSSQSARHELEKQKLELELQRLYGDTYKELISEVRRKQHDFNNQLSVLYSMHLTATSLEDLVEKQSAYGKVLLEENRYDKILVGCNNSILAGYLYYRCVAYEKDGVLIDYQVHVDGAECVLSLHEIIELLGILLTNAFEHCKTHDKTNKIGLKVEESPDKLSIEVSNQTEPIPSDRIAELFKEGKSSKGKERGIGLARVKQLTDRVKADLIVENKERDNNNWINFRILIPKFEVNS